LKHAVLYTIKAGSSHLNMLPHISPYNLQHF